MSDILLTMNPTPAERARAAKHGWHLENSGTTWSKYDHNHLTIIDLTLFEDATFKVTEALDSDDGKVEVTSSLPE